MTAAERDRGAHVADEELRDFERRARAILEQAAAMRPELDRRARELVEDLERAGRAER